MTQILKSSGILISKGSDGDLLLTVDFRDLGNEKPAYSWMPQWNTVRELIRAAVIIESINKPESKELKLFEACLEDCYKDRHSLQGLFYGQFGIEG